MSLLYLQMSGYNITTGSWTVSCLVCAWTASQEILYKQMLLLKNDHERWNLKYVVLVVVATCRFINFNIRIRIAWAYSMQHCSCLIPFFTKVIVLFIPKEAMKQVYKSDHIKSLEKSGGCPIRVNVFSGNALYIYISLKIKLVVCFQHPGYYRHCFPFLTRLRHQIVRTVQTCLWGQLQTWYGG